MNYLILISKTSVFPFWMCIHGWNKILKNYKILEMEKLLYFPHFRPSVYWIQWWPSQLKVPLKYGKMNGKQKIDANQVLCDIPDSLTRIKIKFLVWFIYWGVKKLVRIGIIDHADQEFLLDFEWYFFQNKNLKIKLVNTSSSS